MAFHVNGKIFGWFPKNTAVNVPVLGIIYILGVVKKIVFKEAVGIAVVEVQSTK